MNVPYFSIITTPGMLISWILFLLFVISFSCFACYFITNTTKLKILLMIFITILYTLGLTWLFIGDSTTWSEPIGLWLRGK